MSQSPKKMSRRLQDALRDRTPVTIRRKHLDWDTTDGYVVGLTDEWIVLHELDHAYLDGMVMLRRDLVSNVQAHGCANYVQRATAGLGVELATVHVGSDATVADLLRLAADQGSVIGAHLESREGDWINYGRVHRIGRKRLHLQFVGRDGVWKDFVDSWRLRDITRIECGGRYIYALRCFSDPVPEVVSRKKRD